MGMVPSQGGDNLADASAVVFRHHSDTNNEYIYMSDIDDQPGSFYFVADRSLPTRGSVPEANAKIFAGSSHFSGGTGSVSLTLEADTDNSNENDQPSIIFSQDNGAVNATVGFIEGDNHLTLKNTSSKNESESSVKLKENGDICIGKC